MKSELWQRLRAARDYADKRQEDIAKACGVSRGAVALWERNIPDKRTRPDIRQIQIVAKETGLPLEWLLNDSADPSDVWRVGGTEVRAPIAQAAPARALETFVRAVEYEVTERAPTLVSAFNVHIGPVHVDFAHGRHLAVFAEGEDMDKVGRLLAAERAGGALFVKHLLVWKKDQGLTTLPPLFDIDVVLVASPRAAADLLVGYCS